MTAASPNTAATAFASRADRWWNRPLHPAEIAEAVRQGYLAGFEAAQKDHECPRCFLRVRSIQFDTPLGDRK